jgi:hypothetical protein
MHHHCPILHGESVTLMSVESVQYDGEIDRALDGPPLGIEDGGT